MNKEVYFALIIPAYNEEKRLPKTLNELETFFAHNHFWKDKQVEIIVVDDGSEDKTSEVVKKYAKVVTLNTNLGKGGAVQAGVQSVNAKYYGFIDADLSYSPQNFTPMVQKLESENADMVIGNRYGDLTTQGYSTKRAVLSNYLRKFVHFLTGMKFADTQCGLKVFSSKLASSIIPLLEQKRFSFDIEFLIKAEQKNFKIQTHNVTFLHNHASSITLKDGLRYILDVFAIYDKLNPKPIIVFYKFLLFTSFLFSFLLFGWVIFTGHFFSDDFTWLWHGKKIANQLLPILTFRMSSFYSPVLNAFYSFLYSTVGVSASFYFFLGIIVHTINAFLFSIIAYRLSSSRIMAVMSLLLVIVAGGAYEPLVWVGSNMHSIATLFILLCLLFYDKFLQNRRISYLIITFVSFLFALGTKEIAIVLPFLLLGLCIYRKPKFELKHIFLVVLIALISILYAIQQYIWQKSSVWVSSGAWDFSFSALLKTPIVLLDIFAPLHFILNNNTAVLLWIISICTVIYIALKFSKLKLVLFGFYWMLFSIAPTIFFQTENWWSVLASRYTYLPRLGMILVVASIFSYLIRENKARYIISTFAIFLVAISVLQFSSMLYITSTEYAYVYASGRTLQTAIEELDKNDVQQVYVDWNRPFTTNHAYIVGAFDILKKIPEENISFVENPIPLADTKENMNKGDVLLYWDANARSYEIYKK